MPPGPLLPGNARHPWSSGRTRPEAQPSPIPEAGAARLVRGGGTPTLPTQATREPVRQLAAAGAQVVDVLTAAEYRSTHLSGAVNLPLKELDARTEQLDRCRPVIVYCHDTV